MRLKSTAQISKEKEQSVGSTTNHSRAATWLNLIGPVLNWFEFAATVGIVFNFTRLVQNVSGRVTS